MQSVTDPRPTTRFRDRAEAGRALGAALAFLAPSKPLVLGLPRGGVPVAYEVARALDAPLDVWIVRKIGVPWQPELGVGAVAEGGFVQYSADVLSRVEIPDAVLREITEAERAEVESRVRKFRGTHPRPALRERTVIVVDDGIATGGTLRVALRAIRSEKPKALVLAAPVAPPDVMSRLAKEVDRAVVLKVPPDFSAVGRWYDDFAQVPDAEVRRLLQLRRVEIATPAETR
jgi:putative phosphoribosyl transferase